MFSTIKSLEGLLSKMQPGYFTFVYTFTIDTLPLYVIFKISQFLLTKDKKV